MNKKRNPRFKDITGQQFGTLSAICVDDEKTNNSKGTSVYWKCICSCGKEKSILGSHLRNGSIVTCGDRKMHWSGKNASNWRGGTTSEIQCARSSKEYAEWRNKVYALDCYTCQCCLKRKQIKKEAHHMYNFSNHEELRYDPYYSITLCYDCHSMYSSGSFHHIYGTKNNTPQQLQEYINKKRKQLGIIVPFNIDEYMRTKNRKKMDYWLSFINNDKEDDEWMEILKEVN